MVAARVLVDPRRAAELARHHHEGGVEQAPPLEVAHKRCERLVERRHRVCDPLADPLVHVPAAVGKRDKPHASLDEPPGEQHPLACLVAAILVTESVGLGLDVKGGTGLGRTHQCVGPLVEGIHGGDCAGILESLEMATYRVAEPLPRGKPGRVDAAGQGEVADGEVIGGRIGADGEGAIGAAEITSLGVGRRQPWDADVWREVCPRPVLVRDHTPEARVGERGAGPIAREHVVGAPLVGSLAVGHRPHDGDSVGDAGRLHELLAELHPRDRGVDGPKLAAVFDGREGLGVERFLLGPPAGQPDMDHALGGSLEVGKRLGVGPGRLHPE